MARASLLILFAALLCAVSACQPGPLDDAVSNNDEQILRVLLDLACKLDTREIVSDRPAAPRGRGANGSGHNLQFGLDLALRPAHRARWPHENICKSVRVVANEAIDRAFAHDTAKPPQWIDFGAAFGGARHLLRVSLPVYSADGARAVIYTAGTCPFTCGAGFYHELRRSASGHWVIMRSENAWTSRTAG